MKINIKYAQNFVDPATLNKYKIRKKEVFNILDHDKMNGWLNPNLSCLNDILRVKEQVLNNSQCLVVVGIGGSLLGSYALYEMFTPYFDKAKFPVIFVEPTLSSTYMIGLLKYLEKVDFSLNVVSKSGTTFETILIYEAIKQVMEEKYSSLELQKRIIITTNPDTGSLKKEALEKGYEMFEIPNNIVGRYSLLTAAHLFPLSFCLDIKELILGYRNGLTKREEAFDYATIRRSLFDGKKYIESFVTYENNWYYYLEWVKQLFAESEVKNGKGIFPVSIFHTRDLHSLEQFFQEGNTTIFETFFKIRQSHKYKINGKDLHSINKFVEDTVIATHVKKNIPCMVIELEDVTSFSIGEISSFLYLTAAFSGYLFYRNPFKQPEIEDYKKSIQIQYYNTYSCKDN